MEGGIGLKSIQEVFERIEAFEDDMEELGVHVQTSVEATPIGFTSEVEIILRTLVREDIEDLEAEG